MFLLRAKIKTTKLGRKLKNHRRFGRQIEQAYSDE